MSGQPTLLMIHGLGATPGVWHELTAELDWPGPVLAPALAGHADAPWTGDYSLGALAAGVSAHCDDGPVVAVGHSLGGAVALALASGFFRPAVQAVIAVGVKVAWSAEDVAGVAKVAAKGVRWFDTEAEAVDRFLLQAGLAGLVGHDHPAVDGAVVAEGGRFRVAQDPATFAQKALDTDGLLRAATCPVVLGAGEGDAMVSRDDLAVHVADPRIAAGRGHNVQVEDPAWVAGLIAEVAG